MSAQNLNILYRLLLTENKVIEFPIEIDRPSTTYIPPAQQILPFWANLEYQQCNNCTLRKEASPFCPVATNLIPLLELCSTVPSYEALKIEVITPERTISGNTTMQRALSSILGLIMATSPCPHTEYLKPMARFHLPLASENETLYRTTSMYLLAQYFRRKDGLDYSLELDQLTEIYNNLKIVNKALAKRFRAAITEDATVNAIILLDLLSQAVTWSIEDGLEELKYLFASYDVKLKPNC
ncbi:MAG: DUF6901 family protein [Gammaproteobacteria bacterium]